jgi:hypothetical protein
MGKNKHKTIPTPKLPEDETIKFSFRCYDESGKFCLSKWEKEDVSKVLKRLKELNRKTYGELHREKTVYHFHPVDWNTTTEKSGYADNYLKDKEPFQIALIGINNQKARMYGAFERNIFYIVWFDFEHLITPSVLKHT